MADKDLQKQDSGGQEFSDHIVQNRHLFRQAQMGLTEGERLQQASAELNTAQSYDDVLMVLQRHTIIGQNAQHINLNYFDRPWTDDQRPEWVIVLTRWSQITGVEFPPRYPLGGYETLRDVLGPDRPALIEDLLNDPRLDEDLRALYQGFGTKSVLMVPLTVSGNWVGFLNVVYTQATIFPQAEVRLLMMLVSQAAVAVQNFYNLALAEQRANELAARVRQEQLVRAITDKIRRSADTEAILRTTLQEIGQMLGATKGIARLGTQAQLLMQHEWVNKADET